MTLSPKRAIDSAGGSLLRRELPTAERWQWDRPEGPILLNLDLGLDLICPKGLTSSRLKARDFARSHVNIVSIVSPAPQASLLS